MTTRVNGSISADQNLAGYLQYYTVYMSSPLAYTDPQANPSPSEEIIRRINVLHTGDLADQSQKNFEILFQSIALRASPVIFNTPESVEDLSVAGAPNLSGEGFVWKFACDRADMFYDYSDNNPVGLLIKELDGVILSSGIRVTTEDFSPSGTALNIEFACVNTF